MELEGIRINKNVPLAPLTTFRVGGPAEYFTEVQTAAELLHVFGWCRAHHMTTTLLGRGSNMLVRDGGIPGMVVRLSGDFRKAVFSGTGVSAGAGMLLHDLVTQAQERELAGMEFLSGIPGSVGGAVVSNAGAHGGEMKDLVKAVTFMDPNGAIQTRARKDLEFRYRHSSLADTVVLTVDLELKKGDPGETRKKISEWAAERARKQPLSLPSAGSIFKNPQGVSAARLIEDAGLKGVRIGDAEVSSRHANFIVNLGHATARDIISLIEQVQSDVKLKSGVELELEVNIVGVEA